MRSGQDLQRPEQPGPRPLFEEQLGEDAAAERGVLFLLAAGQPGPEEIERDEIEEPVRRRADPGLQAGVAEQRVDRCQCPPDPAEDGRREGDDEARTRFRKSWVSFTAIIFSRAINCHL